MSNLSEMDEPCKCGHPRHVHVIRMINTKCDFGCAHGLWSDKECPCVKFVSVAPPEAK